MVSQSSHCEWDGYRYTYPYMADDFSVPVKRVLASRVGNLCSNPECRALTSGPQDNPEKAVNIGIGAHITAASRGGARYDPDLLPEERSGPSNGIWLCQNCAKLVDNDPARFTVDLLEEWKTNAEADARKRVGKTADKSSAPSIHLKPYERVRIEPIVPRAAEQADWIVQSTSEGNFVFQKADSQRYAEIPASFIEKVHSLYPFRTSSRATHWQTPMEFSRTTMADAL
jgi:hypothetical protein